MTAIPVGNPLWMKTARVTIDTFDFTDAIEEAAFNPSFQTSAFTAVNSKVIQGASPTSWVLQLGFAQDLAAAGLARYLIANDGKIVKVKIVLQDGTEEWTATVTLKPASLGGKVDGNVKTATVTLPLIGAPTVGADKIDTTPSPEA